MLDNLLDIEVAYSLLRGGSDDSSKDPIDVNYEKLKTDIKVTGRTLSEASSALTPSAGSPNLPVCRVSRRAPEHRWLGHTPALPPRPSTDLGEPRAVSPTAEHLVQGRLPAKASAWF